MTVPKICGIETEYGIIHNGVEDSNPVVASSLLINSYLVEMARSGEGGPAVGVSWDFEDEMPGNDIRGITPLDSLAPEVETHLVNSVLTNGSRYYVDHAHPELSTPECSNALDVTLYDKAAELILIRSMEAAANVLPPEQELVVYKNNSDGKGNSYGCHENYLMSRDTPFAQIVTHTTAHLVTRQIFTGSGKVGSEAPAMSTGDVPFQITQRADFFEEEVGLETTLRRPIINTRDEPHADALRYRRLHVITGDANMSEIATFLKVGSTAIVLAMIEDDVLPREHRFASPVQAMRQVSYDVSLTQPLELADGTTATALEIQWDLLDQARKYANSHGLDSVGGEIAETVIERWEQVLTLLESEPMSLADQLDWIAKYQLLQGLSQRHGLSPTDARLRTLDIQYHDLRPHKSVAARVGLQTLLTTEQAKVAIANPPSDTRAYFRGQCLKRWSSNIVSANWDSLVFDLGEDCLRRMPLADPNQGAASHVDDLLAGCESATELLQRFSKSN
ncbi:MAG: proteasome accessory factor PafA2 [Acidimicrobiia bacterium]|nr:proteasome accessory factor PafA2 [Acidimicrobiia bacterium]MYC58487.1 proteasome accessory factor PafA2 [Acidimicrobiia bacterium]MYG94245.1 proteasome accessory factor PafA2 [Acidimicrobiia bacterium]MYI30407.1 proteasome accessory factor PafA2 [Acidimicrobiia bacterium]